MKCICSSHTLHFTKHARTFRTQFFHSNGREYIGILELMLPMLMGKHPLFEYQIPNKLNSLTAVDESIPISFIFRNGENRPDGLRSTLG